MPVTPASVSATKATPLGTRSSKSSALSVRFTILYCFSELTESRYRPRTVVRMFSRAMRHSVASDVSRNTLMSHVPTRAFLPNSASTST